MVKRWLTPHGYDRPGSHLEIQHVHGQRMIEPLKKQTRIPPKIFLEFQHAHGQKIIDPPDMTYQDLI